MKEIFLPTRRRFLASVATIILCFYGRNASAESSIITTSRPFAGVEKTDLAGAWINFLFRGDDLPLEMSAYAAPLSFAASGLREAMGLYSVGVLILAAMLVFYHLAAMVVETAHSGIPFGQRANQVWMPIRFVLAIGLLVPVNSSLSAGQYLVVRIAEQGSDLASNAWATIANAASGHLEGLAAPRGPDITQFVAAAIEMEICKNVYTALYTPLENETAIHAAGPILDMDHIPSDRFTVETWRYTNILNFDLPMCGELRFAGFRPTLFQPRIATTSTERMAADLSTFSHAEAIEVMSEAAAIGGRAGSVFLQPNAPIGADLRNDLTRLETSETTKLSSQMTRVGLAGQDASTQILIDSTRAGWIAAASFIPELVRLQEGYSEMLSRAVPDAEGPLFSHPKLARRVLIDAVTTSQAFSQLEGATPDRLKTFYAENARIMALVHAWLYSGELADTDFTPPSSADFADHLSTATDSEFVASFLAEAIDQAALAKGVWGEDPQNQDSGYPFAAVAPDRFYNPFTVLVEFGRRQIDLAQKISGLVGQGISVPGATGPSIVAGLVGILFFLGGILLVFVIPLLPFLRFLLGAVAWVLLLFEAVVAVPIVALAHLTPVGGGLSGSLARQAYMLWLALFVRPVLTLFGFVFGLLIFILSLSFINAIFTPFARLAMPTDSGLLLGANVGLVLLYDVLVYAAANASFKTIHALPDHALRWTSRFVVTDPGESVRHPAVAAGAGSGSTTFAPIISTTAGSTTINVATGGSGTSGGSGGSGANAKSAALIPQYGERTAAADFALGATTMHSVASRTSDPSPGKDGPSAAVNVSSSVTARLSQTTAAASRNANRTKGRFQGGEHEATMGHKERGEGEEAPAAPPDPAPKSEPE